jgi:superfamily I DNA/RNA helicase
LIVGDPNQSIYESPGGFSMPKTNLKKLLGFNLLELGLTKNYRSSDRIINYFEHYKTYPNTIEACGCDKDYPSTITYNTSVSVDNIINEIASLILFNVTEQGISPNEICIVAPLWGLIAKNRLCRQKRTEIRQKAHIQLDKLLFLLFLTVDTGMKRT